MAERSNGVGVGAADVGAGSVAGTTTARTSVCTRRLVPVCGYLARNEESGTGTTG